MTGEQEYVIISDDDGHKFVCPADKQEEAGRVFEAISRYWSDGKYDGDPPDVPDYLHPIGGAVSLVKFKHFRIE